MTSAAAPDAAGPPPPVAGGGGACRAAAAAAGAMAGAAAGSVLGVLDALRSALDPAGALPGSLAPAAALLYAVVVAAPSALVGLASSRPVAAAAAVALAATLGAGLAANYWFLPAFLDPGSLAADAGIAAAGLAGGRWLARRFRRAGAPRARVWAATLAVSAAASAALAAGTRAGDGPAPVVVAERAGPRPDVVLVVVDTLRADGVGWSRAAGAPRTPALDALAAESAVFTLCRAPSSWTKPSTASLLTGLYPPEHGTLEPDAALPREATTLAEVLRAAGYRTAAFSDNPWITPVFGYGQGFERFTGRAPSALVRGTLLLRAGLQAWAVLRGAEAFAIGPGHDLGAPALLEAATAFLEERADPRPAFAYIHLIEPHAPYTPRPPHDGGRRRVDPPPTSGLLPFDRAPPLPPDDLAVMRANYDGECATVDGDLGRALGRLRDAGALDRAVLVVTSDHGEEFHEHGSWTHGQSLYEELVRVPLLVRAPGGARPVAAARVDAPVSLVDVSPTILALVGVATDAPCSGRNLLPLLGGDALPPRATFGEIRSGPVRARSLHAGRRAVILSEKGAVSVVEEFAFDGDGGAARAVPASDMTPGLLDALRAEFARMERNGLSGARARMDAATEAALRAMGYLGGR